MRGERPVPAAEILTHVTVPAQRPGEAAPAAPSQCPSLASEAVPYQGRSLVSEALKRWLDVALGSVLLIMATVVLLPVCMAIMLDSPGLPLYRQWRSGKAGRPFRILKLRTMVAGAEQLGPALTQDGDPRITRVGSALRRWSIDELPQLFNVLAGHMSLVGPRPELESIVGTYTPRQKGVLNVRPGLTGWAQINGRDDLSIPEKLELELEYVARRTTTWDLTILARTIGVIVSGRGTKW